MSRTQRIVGAAAVGLLAMTTIGAPVAGSSHREAPMIAKDPTADITDLYAFVSPDRTDTVTIIANYTGLQEPAGGPNFYRFDPAVLYWIKVDNTGDGVADHTYTFRFRTQVANPGSFLFSGYGPIGAVDSNVTQTVTVRRDGTVIGQDLPVPPPNIGPRTTPDYAAFAGVHSLTGGNGRVFAGQRDDPFFVDLGAIFDLGGLRPFNGAHLIPLATAKGEDDLAAFNVNSIAIQVPKQRLTRDGQPVEAADAENAVIGVWAGASRRSRTVLDGDGGATSSGDWVQVSRLGNPLINEVLIGVGHKDRWNASDPKDDAQFMARYTDPELAAIINTIYPSLPDTRTTGRTDLVLILGQGVPGLNQTNADGLYDMLRLNMGVAPAATPDRLGALKGDFAGFPNGRRLMDDVVDIELRAIADGYGKVLKDAFGLPNKSPNNAIGDGCDRNDKAFLPRFPYLAKPWQGYRGGDYRSSPC
jgi:hypothetical protein